MIMKFTKENILFPLTSSMINSNHKTLYIGQYNTYPTLRQLLKMEDKEGFSAGKLTFHLEISRTIVLRCFFFSLSFFSSSWNKSFSISKFQIPFIALLSSTCFYSQCFLRSFVQFVGCEMDYYSRTSRTMVDR